MASAVAPYSSSHITNPVQQEVTAAPAAAAIAWDGDHARAVAARPTSTATTMITASMSATVSTGGIVTICRPTNADPPRNVYERSEEHTSELQSRGHLVCRPLHEKKKEIDKNQKR